MTIYDTSPEPLLVKDLIAQLQKCDPEAVVVGEYDGSWFYTSSVTIGTLFKWPLTYPNGVLRRYEYVFVAADDTEYLELFKQEYPFATERPACCVE